MLKRTLAAAATAALIAIIPAAGADAKAPTCKPGETPVVVRNVTGCIAPVLPPRGINPPSKI